MILDIFSKYMLNKSHVANAASVFSDELCVISFLSYYIKNSNLINCMPLDGWLLNSGLHFVLVFFCSHCKLFVNLSKYWIYAQCAHVQNTCPFQCVNKISEIFLIASIENANEPFRHVTLVCVIIFVLLLLEINQEKCVILQNITSGAN